MRIIAWSFFALFLGTASAQAACTEDVNVVGGTIIQRGNLGGDVCFMSINAMNTSELRYRGYLITDQGYFMVFNSFGYGNEAVTTGAREFYFFPRTSKAMTYGIDPKTKRLNVPFTNKDIFSFDQKKAQLTSVGNGKVQITSAIDPANRGGVEFPAYKGLMLDAGFRIGGSPSGLPKEKSTFRDAAGNTCTVTNKEVFVAVGVDDMRFAMTDAELKIWLAQHCPTIKPGY